LNATKRADPEFDRYADDYHGRIDHPLRHLAGGASNYFIELKCLELANLLAELSLEPSQLTVADVGCGIGDFERQLTIQFQHLISLDLSMEMLSRAQDAKGNLTLNYLCADAGRIPMPADTADLVFASCLLHHLPMENMAQTFQELYRICKPGGWVVLFEHNPLNPLTQAVVRTTPLDQGAHLLSASTVRTSMCEHGFEAIQRRYILFAPARFDRWLYHRMRRRLYPFPFGAQYLVMGRKPLYGVTLNV
jgi:ubiquinone/menaquinone biosynthesis C-methylase UbiE